MDGFETSARAALQSPCGTLSATCLPRLRAHRRQADARSARRPARCGARGPVPAIVADWGRAQCRGADPAQVSGSLDCSSEGHREHRSCGVRARLRRIHSSTAQRTMTCSVAQSLLANGKSGQRADISAWAVRDSAFTDVRQSRSITAFAYSIVPAVPRRSRVRMPSSRNVLSTAFRIRSATSLRPT